MAGRSTKKLQVEYLLQILIVTFKKLIGKIHLWLGLSSGLVVFILGITGCIYVFQKEIKEYIYRDMMFVKNINVGYQPLSVLKQNAQAALGSDKPINFSVCYKQPDKAWEFSAYKAGNEKAISYFDALAYYKVAYVDPYTGKVTGVIDYKYEFFNLVKSLHWSLLLNTPYGQPIVGTATLIFVIMLITGVILWWPKKWNRANYKKSFKIKWDAKFKRLNYDLHNVPGFYALLVTAVISLTGLVWAFKWFQQLVYVAAALTTTPPANTVVKSQEINTAVVTAPLDIAFAKSLNALPDAKRIGMSYPAGKEQTIYAYGYRGEETYYNYDQLQFDQYSGKLLARQNYKEKNRGEKLIGMNYDIHVGAVLGLTGKILAFIASLVAASLPVTGTLIWIGRKRKKKYQPFIKGN